MKKLDDSVQEQIILFGQRVRQLRKMAVYTQGEFAKVCNIPREQIGRIERGEINTSIGNLFTISKILSIPPSKMLDFSNLDIDRSNILDGRI